jgi:hypothetical protein
MKKDLVRIFGIFVSRHEVRTWRIRTATSHLLLFNNPTFRRYPWLSASIQLYSRMRQVRKCTLSCYYLKQPLRDRIMLPSSGQATQMGSIDRASPYSYTPAYKTSAAWTVINPPPQHTHTHTHTVAQYLYVGTISWLLVKAEYYETGRHRQRDTLSLWYPLTHT